MVEIDDFAVEKWLNVMDKSTKSRYIKEIDDFKILLLEKIKLEFIKKF